VAAKNGISEVKTSHTESAQAHMEQLRAMRLTIPNFVIPATKNGTQKLSSAASVSPVFVEMTAVAVKNSVHLVRGSASDPDETRGLMSYADAYGPFADELEALAHFVRHSIAAAKFKAGNDALTTYALMQRLAKLPETAELAPYVEDMRRALGRGRKKAAPETPTTEPDPAKPPVPVITK
jgi:hypothetical protein